EDALNLVRNGERRLDPAAVDLILRSVDEVKRMLGAVAAGGSLEPAPESLIAGLDALTRSAADSAAANAGQGGGADEPAGEGIDDDPVLADFEAMLSAAAPPPAEAPGAAAEDPCAAGGDPAPPGGDEMTEEEFDALLDAIQGRAAAPSAAAPAAAAQEPADARRETPSAPSRTPAEQTLRVDANRVDGVMNLVGELVLVRNRLATLRTRVRDEDLTRTLSRLNLVTADLQASVMRLRMQPMAKVFGRFPRVVRDLARQLGKDVALDMRGEGTELDKGMVESLADPLVHLVRNAVDHGIEMPDERERAGKPAQGRLSLSAHQEGNHILVRVTDDGAGLDPSVIKQKALDKGLIDARAALQMADADALQLVFAPGFSTRSEVSDISGRGVGLDVVKSQIARVNGSVDIESDKGRGTDIVIRLPLTLAILPALLVGVAGQRFAVPLPIIEEILDLEPRDCSYMDGSEVLSLRGDVLPLLDLERWVGSGRAETAASAGRRFVVVANTGRRTVALLVHELIGQEEVVIKSLGERLDGLPGFAGATITGDGGIALIVDVGSLFGEWPRLAVHASTRAAGAAA
ncbi:MAG: chemotaxis protein CheA, partial [Gammaproteobacteria bacterium]|nr:chemotaxis protein CheA [Gammaproteobacteria bacterium]